MFGQRTLLSLLIVVGTLGWSGPGSPGRSLLSPAALANPLEASKSSLPVSIDLATGELSGKLTSCLKPAPCTLSGNSFEWTSTEPASSVSSLSLDLPLPLPLLGADGRRALELDYQLQGNGPDSDGVTELRVSALVDGRQALFARHATGHGHLALALPEGGSKQDRLTMSFTAQNEATPLVFRISAAALTNANVPRLGPARGPGEDDDEPSPPTSQSLQLRLFVLVPCAYDIVSAPARVRLKLYRDGVAAPLSRDVTHTRTVVQTGRIRTLEQYDAVTELPPGVYHVFFFQSPSPVGLPPEPDYRAFTARAWGANVPAYWDSRECQQGLHGFHGRSLSHEDQLVTPDGSNVAYPLPAGRSLLVVNGQLQRGTLGSELTSLPLPVPVCPPTGCE